MAVSDVRTRNIYLSDLVWAEVKRRAVIENINASLLVAYVIGAYLRSPRDLNIPMRRAKSKLEDTLGGRTVHLPDQLYRQVKELCRKKGYTISVLTEYLLREYLGLDIGEDMRVASTTR